MKAKFTEVLRLLRAGYSKAEITELLEEPEQEEPEQEEQPANESQPELETPEAEPEAEQHYVDEIARLTSQIETLTKTIQEQNRASAESKKAPEPSDGEQVLKDIIEGRIKK